MKRVIFLVEGDRNDITNFSGIPYFFSRALSNCLDEIDTPLEFIDTSYLLNVEELLHCARQLWQGIKEENLIVGTNDSLRQNKLGYQLNRELLADLQNRGVFEDCSSILAKYYSRVAEQLSASLEAILHRGDVIISQNHFYPYLGAHLPIYYYLDASLVEFYFDDIYGVVPSRMAMGNIKALYRQMEEVALRTARTIFCFSYALRGQLERLYNIPSKQLTVIGAGANLDEFPNYMNRPENIELHILFIGLDFYRKGGATLLKAAGALYNDSVQLTIVTAKEHVPNGSIPRNVTFYPPLSKDQINALYTAADVFVFPTLFEPFGLVVCEAMAFSLPIIASTTFAMPEILGSGNARLLVEPGDVTELIQAIRYLKEHRSIRSMIARYNYLRSKSLFQWKVVAENMLSHLLRSELSTEYSSER